MNPVILLVTGMLLLYAGATGRAEAVWRALVDNPAGSTAGTSTTNASTKK